MQHGSVDGETFRVIAELRGEVAWVVDAQALRLDYLSPAIAMLTGQTPASLCQAANAVPPGGPMAFLVELARRALHAHAADGAGPAALSMQHELGGPDGAPIPVDVLGTVISGPDGAPRALAGSLRDLRAERARHDEQRRFASLLNHEFRTPLATIDGAVQRLEAGAAKVDEPTRQRYRKIQTAVDRLVALLDDFLSPARLQAIGKTRTADQIDPRALLDEAAAQLRHAGREVVLDCAELPAAIRCQPQGLRMVMRLLVDNTLRHAAGPEPVELRGRLVPQGGASANGIEFSVRDHGPGLAPDELERIFEKHVRGCHAAGEGAGLGLYMARSVVDVHGGSLQAHQADGGGAEFVVWLPLTSLGKLAA